MTAQLGDRVVTSLRGYLWDLCPRSLIGGESARPDTFATTCVIAIASSLLPLLAYDKKHVEHTLESLTSTSKN